MADPVAPLPPAPPVAPLHPRPSWYSRVKSNGTWILWWFIAVMLAGIFIKFFFFSVTSTSPSSPASGAPATSVSGIPAAAAPAPTPSTPLPAGTPSAPAAPVAGSPAMPSPNAAKALNGLVIPGGEYFATGTEGDLQFFVGSWPARSTPAISPPPVPMTAPVPSGGTPSSGFVGSLSTLGGDFTRRMMGAHWDDVFPEAKKRIDDLDSSVTELKGTVGTLTTRIDGLDKKIEDTTAELKTLKKGQDDLTSGQAKAMYILQKLEQKPSPMP